jgi:deoxycytidine triphosphate deaminase
MFLLNNEQIQSYVEDSHNNYLNILNFERRMLQHTFYYFRLGVEIKLEYQGQSITYALNKENRYLTLKPNEYAVIETYETFIMSDKVFGMFGQWSDFIDLGLEMVNSPFIDPLFSGRLKLGIWNHSKKIAKLEIGQPIGKVAFFDISDTNPIRVLTGSIIEQRFNRRVPLRDDDPVHPQTEEEEQAGIESIKAK